MASETVVPNAEQIEAWNGKVGAKWTENQERLDRMLAPFGEAVLAAAGAKPGEHVLDIGCGCGATTLEVARAVGPSGRVVGVDISEAMTARGRERAKSLGLAAEFMVADASTYAFAPSSFDLFVSRFGVMFFDDPVSAFANIRRGAKPGARLAFVCWRPVSENPWVMVPLQAALAHMPPPPPAPPGAPGPFAFADNTRVASILSDAGFTKIEIAPCNATMTIGSVSGAIEEAVTQSIEIGPVARLIADQPPELRAKVKESMREALLQYHGAGGVGLGGATWIVTARAG